MSTQSFSIQSTGGEPTTTQIETSKNIFKAEVKDDAAIKALCYGNSDLMPILGQAMILAGIVGGRFYTAINPKSELFGYAVASPPGGSLFGTPVQASLLDNFRAKLTDDGRANLDYLYKDAFPKFVETALADIKSTLNSIWWIHNLFTQGATQDEAIMKKLLDQILFEIFSPTSTIPLGQRRLATTVTKEEDTKFYTKYGFQKVKDQEFESKTGGYKFKLWLLVFPPLLPSASKTDTKTTTSSA